MRKALANALRVASVLTGIASSATAISLNVNDPASIKSAASTIAYGMAKYYHGNESGGIPGILPPPYYWWEAGAMLNSLINYWYYTGDSTYNDIVTQALQFQVSPDLDYMPANQSQSEGNDDQMFWGYTVMAAAELKFPDPPKDQPQWLALAQGVFNSQANRWDHATCNGGLRWQIQTVNRGYTYKNTPANAGLFNLASRLYAYTGNETFHEWADRVYDWMENIGLVNSTTWDVFDGTSVLNNCSDLDHTRWTYNQGIMLNGAAVMYGKTADPKWQTRTQGIWNATSYFFTSPAKIMFEPCELPGSVACNLDQQSFKAYLSRFMAASTKPAPFLSAQVEPYLIASAQAAAAQCDGGTDGVTCGMKWTQGSVWDGSYGVGQQMAALEVIQALLIKQTSAPVTGSTGGTSTGDNNAGTENYGAGPRPTLPGITTADRGGAWALTVGIVLATLGGVWFLLV